MVCRRGGSGKLRLGQKIRAVSIRQVRAELLQALHVRVVEQAVAGGRNVEQEGGVAAHGVLVNVHQLLQGAHLVILMGVPEPAGADGGVDLGGIPDQLRFAHEGLAAAQIPVAGADLALAEGCIVALLAGGGHLLGVHGAPGHHAPLGGTGVAGLIAAPADVRAADVDARAGLQRADGGIVALPVVMLLPAIGPLAAGAVEPDGAHLAVARQELRELVDEIIIVILAGAVEGVIAIPGGEVHAKAQARAPAGVGDLLHHIALAALVGAGGHRVRGVAAGPEAEAVVVLAGEDQALHARGLKGGHPLISV